MDSTKYIGMDVHKEAITIAVLNAAGKLVMESIMETKAITILEFVKGLRGELQLTFEEGTESEIDNAKLHAPRYERDLVLANDRFVCESNLS